MKPLYQHLWLSFKRSPLLGMKIGMGLWLALLGIYFLSLFVALGSMGGYLLSQFYPDLPIEEIGMAYILYYFIGALLIRVIIQPLPSMSIQHYLLLPINKGYIVNHLLLRSVLSYFNLVSLVLILPFVFFGLAPEISTLSLLGVLALVLGWILFNHFAAFYINKTQDLNKRWLYASVLLLLVLLLLDYKGYIDLLIHLSVIGRWIMKLPILAILPFVMGLIVIYTLRQRLMAGYSLEAQSVGLSSHDTWIKFEWLDRYGSMGALLHMEILLILRSKRVRYFLKASFFMLLYPMLIIDWSNSDTPFRPVYLMVALYVGGIFSSSYGMLLLSWNSMHFDLLLTRVVSYRDIFVAKLLLLAASSVLQTLLALPYVFISGQFYLAVLLFLLWHVVLYPVLYMWHANYNSSRIDPNEKGMFNYSGFNIRQFLSSLVLFLIPIIVYYLGDHIGGSLVGYSFVAVVGLAAIIFYRQLIDWIIKVFKKRKYILVQNFKKI